MSNSFDFEQFKANAIEQLKAGVPLSGKDGVLVPLLENLLNSALEGEMDSHLEGGECELSNRRVSIRPTTGIKPLYTTIATVTMNLIVSAAIVLLNPYVTIYISYKIPPFALSVHIPDVSTSIYVEVDSKVLLGLPFCDKAFVR